MTSTLRRTTAVLGSAALLAGGFAAFAGPASATDRPASRITVSASDSEVDPGEQFALRGRLTTEGGRALAGGVVRVQTFRDGAWEDLPGAQVTTNDEGRYRVRVVLSQKGERGLRVVGNPAGTRLRNARALTSVQVG